MAAGDGIDLTDPALFAGGVPYGVFARLRREAPICWHPPGRSSSGFWVLSRYADISAAASSRHFSAQAGGTHLEDLPIAGLVVAMMDGPRHAALRRLIGPALGGYGHLAGELRHCAEVIVRDAVRARTCDFARDVAGRFASLAMALLIGAPVADRGRLIDWADQVSGLADRRSGYADEGSRRTGEQMRMYCRSLLAAPGSELASVLANGHVDGQPPLSADEREANLLLLLLTGNEQPRNTAAGGVLALAQHPNQWRFLRTDRSLLPGAVEEMLRWAPPNPYNRRTITHDLAFRGAEMRAGEKVTLWWPSANRDEAVFHHPEEFDIYRRPNPHLSFGFGSHECLGARLGRLELTLLLEQLLDQVNSIELTGPVAWAPVNKHAVVTEMPVRLLPD